MELDIHEKTLTLTIDELVTVLLCRRFGNESDMGAYDDSEAFRAECARLLPEGEAIDLVRAETREGYSLRLTGKADRYTDEGIYLAVPFDGDPHLPPNAVKRRARAVAFLLASLAEREESVPPLHILYFDRGSGKHATSDETPSKKDIAAFYRRACRAADLQANLMLELTDKRRPTMAALRFPFPKRRAGQGELMQAVYRTAKRGGKLYAAAPTGIGKTMSVLYPSVRALGEGEVEKIFYLTPKGTVARAAADAVKTLAERGASIRAVRLYAKELICPRGVVCREDTTACKAHAKSEEAYDRAVMELCHSPVTPTVVTLKELTAVAAKHGLCPHELALCYSQAADVVIGDYHYLFDPHVALRRFFTGRGEYIFLVDEAHDLVERAREMYSATLTSENLDAFRIWTRDHALDLFGIAEKAHERFTRNMHVLLSENLHTDGHGGECAYTHMKSVTEEITAPLERLIERAEEYWLKRRVPEEERHSYRLLLSPIRRFVEAFHAHDSDCVYILTLEEKQYSLTSYCVNPAARLSERMEHGKAAVLFSATMDPLHYYSSVLGADRHSASLSLPSPFPEENLAVAVVDGIRVRYNDRAETLSEILSVIEATVRAKVGNYLVFCPSFDYMDAVAESLAARMRDVAVIKQGRAMTYEARQAFLDRFTVSPKGTTVGFAVMGGVFSESVDLTGDRLVGSIVIGVGLPSPSLEREACAAYYDERCDGGKEYAYLYPGMNRVLQAAGRVIRTETDRGVLVLIDDRFRDPFYRAMIPTHMRRSLRFTSGAGALIQLFRRFWEEGVMPEGTP